MTSTEACANLTPAWAMRHGGICWGKNRNTIQRQADGGGHVFAWSHELLTFGRVVIRVRILAWSGGMYVGVALGGRYLEALMVNVQTGNLLTKANASMPLGSLDCNSKQQIQSIFPTQSSGHIEGKILCLILEDHCLYVGWEGDAPKKVHEILPDSVRLYAQMVFANDALEVTDLTAESSQNAATQFAVDFELVTRRYDLHGWDLNLTRMIWRLSLTPYRASF